MSIMVEHAFNRCYGKAPQPKASTTAAQTKGASVSPPYLLLLHTLIILGHHNVLYNCTTAKAKEIILVKVSTTETRAEDAAAS